MKNEDLILHKKYSKAWNNMCFDTMKDILSDDLIVEENETDEILNKSQFKEFFISKIDHVINEFKNYETEIKSEVGFYEYASVKQLCIIVYVMLNTIPKGSYNIEKISISNGKIVKIETLEWGDGELDDEFTIPPKTFCKIET